MVVRQRRGSTNLVLVGAEAEVLDGLTGLLGAAQEQGVGTRRLLQSKLVQGQGTAAGSGQAGAGRGGEAQGSDLDLGDGQQAVVVGDGADNDNGLLSAVAVAGVGRNARQRHGRAVDARHKEAAQDDLVEGSIGTAWVVSMREDDVESMQTRTEGGKLTGKEAVELHEQLQVDVVALGGGTVRVPHVVVLEIDTYRNEKEIPPSQPFGSLVCSKQKRDFERGRPEQEGPDGSTRRVTRKTVSMQSLSGLFSTVSVPSQAVLSLSVSREREKKSHSRTRTDQENVPIPPRRKRCKRRTETILISKSNTSGRRKSSHQWFAEGSRTK